MRQQLTIEEINEKAQSPEIKQMGEMNRMLEEVRMRAVIDALRAVSGARLLLINAFFGLLMLGVGIAGVATLSVIWGRYDLAIGSLGPLGASLLGSIGFYRRFQRIRRETFRLSHPA